MKLAAPLCPACTRAKALLSMVAAANNGPASTPDDLVVTLPLILEDALAHLLREFDYDAHPDTQTATAARLVAISIDQLYRARPRTPASERVSRTRAAKHA